MATCSSSKVVTALLPAESCEVSSSESRLLESMACEALHVSVFVAKVLFLR